MQHRVLLTDLTFKQTDRNCQSRRTKRNSGRIGCLQLKRKLPSCLMRKPIKSRPILSAVFSAQTLSGGTRFREALTKIAKQDSTIEINSEPMEERAFVSARSATHLEEIRGRLLNEYGLLVNISDLKVIYLETIRKKAEAEGKYIRQTGGSGNRSEERRVGKECRSRWSPY